MWRIIVKHVTEKSSQYIFSIFSGVLLAFEASLPYFMLCVLAVILDVISAFFLGRRMHKKEPLKYDGKFKSEYKYRIIVTLGVMFIIMLLAGLVDIIILKSGDMAARSAMSIFLFYEGWSVLENWSSENNNKIARALQRIMVNKAERHINVPLSDILLEEDKKEDGEV